jgi:hypothetical protein
MSKILFPITEHFCSVFETKTFDIFPQKYREVQRSTKKYREVQRSTEKYEEVQRSTEKYEEVQRSTEKYREVRRSTEKYRSLLFPPCKSSRQISNNRRITIGSDKLTNLLRDKPSIK